MLKCDEQVATISNVNLRAEKHGDDPVPACDIAVRFQTGAKVLDSLAKGLRSALYSSDEANGQKRVPGTGSGDDGEKFRFNGALGPLKIKKEWPGYKAGIVWGDLAGSINLQLADVNVTRISAEPQDGGTVEIALQLQCHPTKEAYGDLAQINQREITLTLTPPSASLLKKLEKEKAKAAERDEDEGK